MTFKEIKTALKRAEYIHKRRRWWDRVVPEIFFLRSALAYPWTHNYIWLMKPRGDLTTDLVILDMWARAINRWCDKHEVDAAPYCVRKSCAAFIASIAWLNPKEL